MRVSSNELFSTLKKCDLYRRCHESAAERAWGRGTAADSVFFLLFFGGLSPRLRERQRVQASA